MRLNITLPDDLAEELRNKPNKSGYIVAALREKRRRFSGNCRRDTVPPDRKTGKSTKSGKMPPKESGNKNGLPTAETGFEIVKTMPAVIISNNANNQYAQTVTVLPVTSNVSKVFPFETPLPH